MRTIWKLTLSQIIMYSRDRQSVFFAFFFPLFFMLALGFLVNDGEMDPIALSVVEQQVPAEDFIAQLQENELLTIHSETEEVARKALSDGDRKAILLLPSGTATTSGQIPLSIILTQGDPDNVQILAILQSALIDIEHAVRGTQPLFTMTVEDVAIQGGRYIDFLLPGLIAFMVMQLSVAGSGFNIVEYKRKGILKRLFVTPLRPIEFIIALILSRVAVVLAQITLLLVVGELIFDISIEGSIALFYAFVIAGSVLFLGLGFALGGVAKTQNAAMMFGNLLIFPQVFLAGVFFAPESLPAWIQPFASVLPLNYVSDALRQIASKGAELTLLSTDILGIAIWTILGIFLAVRYFKWGEAGDA